MRLLILPVSFLLLWNTPALANVKAPTGQNLVRFVCQAYDSIDHEFRKRVIVLDQLSTKPFNKYTDHDTINGSDLIDPKSRKNNFYGMRNSARFRLRIYIATLISRDRTEEEIIEELLKRPGDHRVAKYEFQDPARMDYTGRGDRIQSRFDFVYERKSDGFYKSFGINLDEFPTIVDNLRDLDTISLKILDNTARERGSIILYPSMKTNVGSTILMEDGTYICRKPVLIPEKEIAE